VLDVGFGPIINLMKGRGMKIRCKRGALFVAVFTMMHGLVAFADDYDRDYVTARVISAEPMSHEVTRKECHQQPVQVQVDVPNQASPPSNNPMGMLLGAAAGGLLGHQVGNGSGNTAATLAGAAGGAFLGNKLANQNQAQQYPGSHEETRTAMANVCNDVKEDVPDGYDVVYEYGGSRHEIHMNHRPGRTIRLHLSVED
jgi:uncharacterized protein YcfJ